MIINTNSSFVSYQLTPGELEAGSHFSPEQRAVIQNLIAETAEEKVSLTYDPSNPLKFTQAEAELQGKIGILKYLLELENTLKE
jgi:hypothetical protein